MHCGARLKLELKLKLKLKQWQKQWQSIGFLSPNWVISVTHVGDFNQQQ